MKYAPIIIFAFSRLESLIQTVTSVLDNTEAKESDLFVFVDGAREKKEGENEKVHAVHEYVKTISGFKSIHYSFSSKNKGLGPSIIEGVTNIINLYGSAIILEDDLIVSKSFLSFINQGLIRYKNEPVVFSICGYSNKITIPNDYTADAYFCTRSSSWGWATWADRWNSVDWELSNWSKVAKTKTNFNKWGGSDCFGMLKAWKSGQNQSWAIRFCYSQFFQNKVALFPNKSKVKNTGFDGLGTNCHKYNRFKSVFDKNENKNFVFPDDILINKKIYSSAISYHSLYLRAWSKLMYMLNL